MDSIVGGASTTSTVFQNTLTLANTDLLLSSGVLSIAAVHHGASRTSTLSAMLYLCVVDVAILFLTVQGCEYLHLYWGLASCALAVSEYYVV